MDDYRIYPLSLALTEMSGREPRMTLEEGTKSGGIGEMELIGDLLDGAIGVLHKENAASDDGAEHYLLNGVATD